MHGDANETFNRAVKLLAKRDHTVAELKLKLGEVPDAVIERLVAKRYLDDRRYAETYVARRKHRGPARLRAELMTRGIAPDLAEEIVTAADLPSLHEVVAAKMEVWKLRSPLRQRDAARLFRALARLGYEEEAIREEIEQLHE